MAKFMSLVQQTVRVSLKKFLQLPLEPYGTMLMNGGVQTETGPCYKWNRPC